MKIIYSRRRLVIYRLDRVMGALEYQEIIKPGERPPMRTSVRYRKGSPRESYYNLDLWDKGWNTFATFGFEESQLDSALAGGVWRFSDGSEEELADILAVMASKAFAIGAELR